MRRKILAWMTARDTALEGVAFDAMLAVLVAAVATASLRSLFGYL